MAKKSKEMKFTQEELTSLQELQQGYDNIRNSMGALEISRIQLEQRLENLSDEKLRLETEYSNLVSTEQTLVGELNEKYGPGNLDPTTGVFTPTK
jgi:predicted nuclease with TOPRIM domain